MNATGHPNYGWGNYNMASHNVEGSSVYIIKTRSGAMMKIAIDMKYSMQQRFVFRFADLETKAEKSGHLIDYSGKMHLPEQADPAYVRGMSPDLVQFVSDHHNQ